MMRIFESDRIVIIIESFQYFQYHQKKNKKSLSLGIKINIFFDVNLFIYFYSDL